MLIIFNIDRVGSSLTWIEWVRVVGVWCIRNPSDNQDTGLTRIEWIRVIGV